MCIRDSSSPLYRDIQKGTFTPADELENLQEERRLLELLELKHTEYDGFHDFIEFRVRGTLPEDKAKMLASLDKAIEAQEGKEALFSYIA